MKKRLKFLAGMLALLLLTGAAWLGNGLFGNPVSRYLATATARRHIASVYAGTDYRIEDVRYNFKDGRYHAFIESPGSIDTTFSLLIGMTGKLQLDTFDDVTGGSNTAHRLEQEYRTLTDAVFADADFPYVCDIAFGTLEIYPGMYIGDPQHGDIPQYALNQDLLIIDHIYDIRTLGAQAGHLVIYVESDDISVNAAADIMLGVRAKFDSAGVPFAAMSFTLQQPLPDDGPRPEDEIHVAHFPCGDIRPDGMTDRVQQAHDALSEYYRQLDEQCK